MDIKERVVMLSEIKKLRLRSIFLPQGAVRANDSRSWLPTTIISCEQEWRRVPHSAVFTRRVWPDLKEILALKCRRAA